MTQRATCGGCKWWQDARANIHIDGICRRHAPRPNNGAECQHNTGTWPSTLPTDWCGEHAPATEPAGEVG